jgi:4-hydroxy-tetrahydrodipicolinate reductase
VIRIGISGAAGRMGRSIIEVCRGTDGVVLGGALERQGSADLGRDAGELAGGAPLGVVVAPDLAGMADRIDVLVEFTSPAATVEHVRACREHGLRMVIGTTGFDAAQRREIAEAARSIAIVQSPNMSIGVNLCFSLAEIAARIVGKGAEIGVWEAHHAQKKDAPSGTALRLGEIVARTLGLDFDAAAARAAAMGDKSQQGSIRFESVREGDIVGDHTVSFTAADERVEITHRAFNRRTFAEGAVRAAKWVATKDRGLYDMQDVLGLR